MFMPCCCSPTATSYSRPAHHRRLTPTRAFTCTPYQCILISRVKCEFYCRPPGSVLVHFQKPNKVFITYKTENQISPRRFRCMRCLAEFAAFRGTAPPVMALNNAWSTVRANIWPRRCVYGLCTDYLWKTDCCSKWEHRENSTYSSVSKFVSLDVRDFDLSWLVPTNQDETT